MLSLTPLALCHYEGNEENHVFVFIGSGKRTKCQPDVTVPVYVLSKEVNAQMILDMCFFCLFFLTVSSIFSIFTPLYMCQYKNNTFFIPLYTIVYPLNSDSSAFTTQGEKKNRLSPAFNCDGDVNQDARRVMRAGK